MGIDPGLASTGVGVIEQESADQWRYADSDHVLTRVASPMPERLAAIFALVRRTIERWQPEAVAIESVFFAKNVKSAVLMSHGRGAAILAAHLASAELREYSPLEIKQSVVGKGRAGKQQVMTMVGILLGMDAEVPVEHESDALACALCHVLRTRKLMVLGAGVREEAGPEDSESRARRAERQELLALGHAHRRRRRRR